MDRRLRTPASVSYAFSLPVLGELETSSTGETSSDDVAAEMIASRVTAWNGGEPPTVVLVTSCESQTDADLAASRLAAGFDAIGSRTELLLWHDPGASEHELASIDEPNGSSVEAVGTESRGAATGEVRIARWASLGAIAVLLLVAAALVVITLPGSSSTNSASSTGSSTTAARPTRRTPTLPPLAATLGLPAAAGITSFTPVIVGPPSTREDPLWTVRRTTTGVRLTKYDFNGARVASTNRYTLKIAPSQGTETYRLAPFSAGGPLDLFVLRQTAAGISLSVYGVQGQQPVGSTLTPRLSGLAPIRPRAGVHRDLLMADYSGPNPDLWVLDRGQPGQAPQLTIFSSASSYTTTVAKVKLPLLGLDPAQWAVGVGQVTRGGKPSLVLIRHSGGPSHVQVRVLPGDKGFRTVTLSQTLGLQAGATSLLRFFLGTWSGKPAIYGVDLSDPTAPQLRIAELRTAAIKP